MRHLVLAGGSGFIGQALEQYYHSRGHRVSILTRRPTMAHHLQWDGKTPGDWTKALEGCDVLINLTGKSVDCRYTERNRSEILASRLESTAVLNEVVRELARPPKVWLNASSATIYEHSEDRLMTERDGICGDDFSMSVCKKWEREFLSVEIPGVRKVALRTSIVFSPSGGALQKMLLITRLGLGGRQGTGRQKVSWIHMEDFCRAVDFIIGIELTGVLNVTAPEPTTNAHLMKLCRSHLKVPFGLPTPAWLLAIGAWLIRTETELLLKSRNVYPERLLEAGFVFNHADIDSGMQDLLGA